MRRATGPRVFGPYQHGEVFRLHVVTGSGRKRKTSYLVYSTRALAEAALKGARDQAQGTTVRQAIDAYLEAMRARGRGAKTIETAEHRLWNIAGMPASSERPLRWLNGRGAELYAAAQVGHAPDTHHKELSLGKSLGEFCVKRRWLRANPFAEVEPVGQKRHGSDKPRHTVDESRVLRAYCHGRIEDPAAVLTLGYQLLGPRASELVTRTVRDLDNAGRLLVIGKTKTKAGTRRLVVPDELRGPLRALANGKASGDRLFGDRSRYWARDAVRRICKDAGVPVLPPQGLRRTHSDLATDAGVAGIAVSQHLGHDIGGQPQVTTRSYVSRSAAANARAARVLEVLDGGAVEIDLEISDGSKSSEVA